MRRIAIGAALSVMLFCGCGKQAPPEAPAKPKQDWAQEEILLQLKEMREDISRLQQQSEAVKSLDARLTALESAARAAPAKTARGPEVKFDGATPRGSASAKVAVVEFTDFECPYCARHFHEVFPKVKEAFIDTGRIRYYARNYPLDFHAGAKPAAIAAFCAGKISGKYWEMHERLFSRKGTLSEELYRQTAQSIGIDPESFTKCLAETSSAQHVDADAQYASSVGVSGTPKFFIGRIQGNRIVDTIEVSGARSFEVFKSAIDSRLN
ncbi:MAG TPA: thioredoxin domain-containing protein [Steroidobacteraceae bacterium]